MYVIELRIATLMFQNIVQHINDLYKFQDTMIRKGLQPDPNLTL